MYPLDVETPDKASDKDPPAHLMVFDTPLKLTAVQVLAVPVEFTTTENVIV